MDKVDEYDCLTLRLYYKTASNTSEARLLTTLSTTFSLLSIDNKWLLDKVSLCIIVLNEIHATQPGSASHVLGWSWRLNECFALASSVKGLWYTALSVHRSDGWRLCHADEPQRGKYSCPWLPLPGWYGFAHAWVTGEAMCWSMRALCFQFVLTSPSPGVGHSLEKRTFLRFQVY